MGNCEFCAEFSATRSHKNTFFHLLFPYLPDRILLETSNFVVTPGLGQIVEGYLLVITKSHFTSMGELPPRLFPEFDWLVQQSCEILQSVYGVDCLQFEH